MKLWNKIVNIYITKELPIFVFLWIICDYIAVISDYVLISLVVFVEIHLLIKVHTVVTLTSRS